MNIISRFFKKEDKPDSEEVRNKLLLATFEETTKKLEDAIKKHCEMQMKLRAYRLEVDRKRYFELMHLGFTNIK